MTAGLTALRVAGAAALVLLLWNPAATRRVADAGPPLVLLDASLSMAGPRDGDGARGARAHWRRGLDTARALARGGVIWRFGDRVAAFDTAPPADGASRLGPALEAAAARGGEVIVVTDGALDDVAALPADLRARPRVVLLGREPFFDAFVAGVDGPRRVAVTDTLRLVASYGVAGPHERSRRDAVLVASVAGRRLTTRPVTLPDSGMVTAELMIPASRLPPGWSAVEVRLDGVGDSEPRDDARLLLIEVSPQPAVVVLAAPPDWEARFFAQVLADVARVPVRSFVRLEEEDAGLRWRDAATLAPVGGGELARAVEGARLVALMGEPRPAFEPSPGRAVLTWPTTRGLEGDWYLELPPASPLSGALAGVSWDSLPPATAVSDAGVDPGATVVLAARVGRRGPARPVAIVGDSGQFRRATVLATGLWRWQFRGGGGAVAYRTFVAALADWLLGGERGPGSGVWAVPEAQVVANGLHLVWRWTGAGEPQNLPVRLRGAGGEGGEGGGGERVDTLRFDAAGRAEQRLAPGVYRYALAGGAERGQGAVAVETYSDEWRPSGAPRLGAQPGAPAGRVVTVGLRDRWWLFALVLAAFVAEWAWRRRQGLP